MVRVVRIQSLKAVMHPSDVPKLYAPTTIAEEIEESPAERRRTSCRNAMRRMRQRRREAATT